MRPSAKRRRMYFLTPTFRPVGGVVKIFDYVNHALAFGYEPVVCCPETYKPGLPLFSNERFSGISPENGIRFVGLGEFSVGPDDFAFLSWPNDYRIAETRLSRWTEHEQVIFIVQNVRWGNPAWQKGYAVRLLSRPMARIMTNDVVFDAVRPYLNSSSTTEVIDLGHDTDTFFRARSGGFGSPVKVAYTTWKSGVGDRVARLMGGNVAGHASKPGRFEFRAIRNPVGWKELRDLYQWSDVFLSTPLAEEGFYMPGLEAMAAGSIVITPDAGGNRAYCRFGENCLQVGLENAESYAAALEDLRAKGAGEIERLRRAGYETVGLHSLSREERQFGDFLERLVHRLESPEPTGGRREE